MVELRLGVIGSGVVGEATGKSFHNFGHHVVFNDIDEKKLSRLKKEGHFVLPDTVMVVRQSDIVFVCVNTPTNVNGEQDLSQIENVIDSLADGINLSDSHTTVVFRSTILPRTNRIMHEKLSERIEKDDWSYYFNPEFLTAKNALEDLLNPDRVVIGGLTDDFKILEELYSSFPIKEDNIIKTGLEEAEMIKYVANNFLATKISFFNEMGSISRKMSLDFRVIERAVALDKRIGEYGTRSGEAFGGMCFPKDTLAFNTKFPTKILGKTITVNKDVEFYGDSRDD